MRLAHVRRAGAVLAVAALLAVGLSTTGAHADTPAPDVTITATPSIDMLGDRTGTVSITVTSVPAGADDVVLEFGGFQAPAPMALTLTEGSQALPQQSASDTSARYVDLGTPSAGERIDLSFVMSEATAPKLILAATLKDRETGADLGAGAEAAVDLLQPSIGVLTGGGTVEAENPATQCGLDISNTTDESVSANSLRLYFPASAFDGYSAAQVASAMRVSFESADAPPAVLLPWSVGGDGSLTLDIPTATLSPDLDSNGQSNGPALFFSMDYGLRTSQIRGESQWIGADGKPYAIGAYTLSFEKIAPAPGPRDVTGDGIPDLMARDASGNLWLYQGTGNPADPFRARTQIGHGWQIYTMMFDAGDLNGDGHDDLIAIDKSGILWAYAGTGKAAAPYAPRIEIGHGWQIYRTVIPTGDLNNDGHADLLAIDGSGQLWEYRGRGALSASAFQSRTLLGDANWLPSTIVGIGDATNTFDGHAGILQETGGQLWFDAAIDPLAGRYPGAYDIGGGWQVYNQFVPTGDLNADGHPDLVTRDTSGRLWLYLGTGQSSHIFQPRVQIGHGWQIYNLIF